MARWSDFWLVPQQQLFSSQTFYFPPIVSSVSLYNFPFSSIYFSFPQIKLCNLISGLMMDFSGFCTVKCSYLTGYVRSGSGIPGCHDKQGSVPSHHGLYSHEGHILEQQSPTFQLGGHTVVVAAFGGRGQLQVCTNRLCKWRFACSPATSIAWFLKAVDQ